MNSVPFYRGLLQEELVRRCEKNPQYSLRAFAKALNVDAAAVSRILSDQLCPSPKVVEKLMGALDLSPEERRRFLASIEEAYRTRRTRKLNPLFQALKDEGGQTTRELSLESFRVVADWYHFAILELTFVRGFKSDPAWIASQLGITVLEAKFAIERLVKLGLLREEAGTLIKVDRSIHTADQHLSTSALRRRQKQILEMAISALENVPLEERSSTAMTMAIDPRKIPEAKRRIAEFTAELCRSLEDGSQTRVYEVSISLFPIQKRSPRK